jgi:hypothetical protein
VKPGRVDTPKFFVKAARAQEILFGSRQVHHPWWAPMKTTRAMPSGVTVAAILGACAALATPAVASEGERIASPFPVRALLHCSQGFEKRRQREADRGSHPHPLPPTIGSARREAEHLVAQDDLIKGACVLYKHDYDRPDDEATLGGR